MPTTAVAATSIGLLTFQRNNKIRLTVAIKAVSESPMAIFPSSTAAPRIVPIAAASAPLTKPLTSGICSRFSPLTPYFSGPDPLPAAHSFGRIPYAHCSAKKWVRFSPQMAGEPRQSRLGAIAAVDRVLTRRVRGCGNVA